MFLYPLESGDIQNNLPLASIVLQYSLPPKPPLLPQSNLVGHLPAPSTPISLTFPSPAERASTSPISQGLEINL